MRLAASPVDQLIERLDELNYIVTWTTGLHEPGVLVRERRRVVLDGDESDESLTAFLHRVLLALTAPPGRVIRPDVAELYSKRNVARDTPRCRAQRK